MGELINLGDRRPPPPSPLDADYDGLVCPNCGSAWFEMCSIECDGTRYQAMVCLDLNGRITGYTGTPHCFECDTEVIP